MSDATPAGAHRPNNRRRWLIILGIVVLVCAIAYALYWFLYASHFESTDDAYVSGDIVSVTARDSGSVLGLYADNTQAVRRGQLLIEFDPIKAQVAYDAAKADLARTVRSTRTDFSKVNTARAQLESARVTLSQAESDLRRRASAGESVSREEVSHARDAVSGAQAAVRAAESNLAEAEATVQGTEIHNNPDVLSAIARLRQASITLAHMFIHAPIDGVIAQRSAQIGQQIAAGTPLMAVVPLDDVWIDANFKESQLVDMRVGQPVTVTADIYGGGVTYHGHIEGLGAGSGSAFALLPPQNATGNWIKIVQRVPVRVALDPKELRDHPLRVGLSVNVSVDISDTSGSLLGSVKPLRNLKGDPGDGGGPELETEIRNILTQNGG